MFRPTTSMKQEQKSNGAKITETKGIDAKEGENQRWISDTKKIKERHDHQKTDRGISQLHKDRQWQMQEIKLNERRQMITIRMLFFDILVKPRASHL